MSYRLDQPFPNACIGARRELRACDRRTTVLGVRKRVEDKEGSSCVAKIL